LDVTPAILPPGQTAIDEFPRFGTHIRVRPIVPRRYVVRVGGDVATRCEIQLAELADLPRVEQVSDFHCVATWSRLGLRWSGMRFVDVYERLIVPRARPRATAQYVTFRGFDGGFFCMLPIEDALRPNVLLADRLDGEPLTLAHGAPLRVVAPDHYGYKSCKHLAAIDFGRDSIRGVGLIQHPRGRVAAEERGRVLPGALYRALNGRVLLRPLLRRFRRYQLPGV
jgi:DMSO/TMAO reductase YedYZ molybdopterin-dependent catalytic subunit